MMVVCTGLHSQVHCVQYSVQMYSLHDKPVYSFTVYMTNVWTVVHSIWHTYVQLNRLYDKLVNRKKTNITGALVTSDQSYTYDPVNHYYLRKTLNMLELNTHLSISLWTSILIYWSEFKQIKCDQIHEYWLLSQTLKRGQKLTQSLSHQQNTRCCCLNRVEN